MNRSPYGHIYTYIYIYITSIPSSHLCAIYICRLNLICISRLAPFFKSEVMVLICGIYKCFSISCTYGCILKSPHICWCIIGDYTTCITVSRCRHDRSKLSAQNMKSCLLYAAVLFSHKQDWKIAARARARSESCCLFLFMLEYRKES